MMEKIELNILTLNVWGIPYMSTDREARICAISKELNKGKYDVVALQEVWSINDYKIIKNENENVLPFSHYFYSGVVGAGLCVFSKYPIVATLFHTWPVNGYFHRIQHGDWFGGKGVGLCRLLVNNRIINLYNAHLHAEYNSKKDDYKTHRAIQAFDTAQFIQATRGKSILQILAGDLNTQPDDIAYRAILHASKMTDSCPYENIGTNECTRNSYSSSSAVKKNPHGLRIDHIFIRENKQYRVYIDEYKLPFPERVPDQKFSYSDHEAVYVKLTVSDRTSSVLNSVDDEVSLKNKKLEKCRLEYKKMSELKCVEALEECIDLCERSLKKLKTDRVLYGFISMFLTFFLICLVDFTVPYGFRTLYLFLKFVIFALILFMFFMATIWNYMERNGILSSKHSMEIALKSLQNFPLLQE